MEQDEAVREIRILISDLSRHRQVFAQVLFYMFHRIHENSDVNMMTSINLTTIFGNMTRILFDALNPNHRSLICNFMILNYNQIFNVHIFVNYVYLKGNYNETFFR